MKYLSSLLIALIFASGVASAIGDRPERERPRVDAIIDRIQDALEGDLSDRRRAYLEHRLAYLELHSDIRAAMREAFAELGQDATKEQRQEAAAAVREQYSDQLQDLKEARRDAMRQRRGNRGDDAGNDSEG